MRTLALLLACAALPVAAQTTRITSGDATSSGLVGWWPLDEGGADRSGNGNTGGLSNAPVTVSGKLGRALQFNGISQYVNVPDVTGLQIANDIAVSVWVKFTTSAMTVPLAKYNAVSGWELVTSSGGIRFGGRDTPYRSTAASSAINNGAWHHVAGVRTGSMWSLYVDGALSSSTNALTSGSIAAVGTGLCIGRNASAAAGAEFPGSLDDVRIYNRALSAAEISALYHSKRHLYGEGN